MRQIIAYFIKNPISADVLVILLVIFGYFGASNMRSTFFPENESKFISIRIVYPGASPEEVEEGVIIKIEDNLTGLSGIERVTSVSEENSGSVLVESKDGFDIDELLADVKNGVDQISSFPVGMEPAVVAKQELLTNAITFAITGDADLLSLKKFARKVEDDLLASENISKVTLTGFPEEELEISVRENDLRRFNLTFNQVVQAVQQNNIEISGGTVKGSEEELLIRSRNKGYFADDLKDLVLLTQVDGRKVQLFDVATIRDRWAETSNRVFINGLPAVQIDVNNTTDENLLTISDEVSEYIKKFNDEQSQVQAVIVNDGSVVLRQRIDLLTTNGVIGFVLVLILLAMFLQVRLAFWVAIAIPISFMGMFVIAPLVGVTINVLALFGMILVIGILVDDGIVISENIYRHYEMGKNRFDAALDGTLEVLPSVFGAITTTIVAFMSFLFISGTVGDFFSELAIVVMLTLFFSLIEGAFVLPAHIGHSEALKDKNNGEKPNPIARTFAGVQQGLWDFMDWMKDRLYAPVLRFFMRNAVLGLFIPIGFLILSISLFAGGFVKGTFFPNIEADVVTANLKMPAGTPESITLEGLNKMEEAVWRVNEKYKSQRPDGKDIVLITSKKLGSSGGGAVSGASSLAGGGSNVGSLQINLLDSEARNIKSLEVVEAFRQETGTVQGAEVLTYSTAGPFGDPVSIAMRGSNLDELTAAVNELKAGMSDVSDLRDIRDNNQIGLKEINITLKDKAVVLGLNPQVIIAQIRQGFFGAEVQRLQRGTDEVKVWVRYSESDRSSIGKLEDMRIRTADGGSYPLKELVEMDYSRGIIAINHLDREREIRITSGLASDDVSASDMNTVITSEILPDILEKYPSVRYSLEGQVRESAKTVASAKQVLPIAFFTILTIIIITFRSWSQTLAVGLSLPFGFIGVIIGHMIFGKAISMLSMMGVFALIGIMVNDALVLVNAFNGLIKDGKPFKEALYEACLSRFRPIFLTSITTIAGLGPLIFEKSFQAQFLIPMAISIAFGLAIATLIILITLPVYLVLFNQYKGFIVWLWKGEWLAPELIEPAFEKRQNYFWLYVTSSIGFIAFFVLLSKIPQLFT